MCLYMREKQPRVAKRDIRVLKCLEERDGNFRSPSQGTPIVFGEPMIARPDVPNIESYDKDMFGYDRFTLSGGAIYAKLYEKPDYGNTSREAIIPAGTEYWLDSFGREIAATRMIIIKDRKEDYEHDKDFALDILESAPVKNGIRIADYMLSSGSFVHPEKLGKKAKDVIGRVVGFRNDKPLIAAIEYSVEQWDTQYDSKVGKHYDTSEEALKDDIDGISKMRKYKENRNENLKAFNYCADYRADKKEEWYFPTLADVTTMLNNTLYINAAVALTGVGEMIDDRWFWTSSECSSDGSWGCYLGGDQVDCGWGGKNYRGRVVPFFASFTDNRKSKRFLDKLKTLWK